MLVLGLVLVGLGALLIVAAIFTTEDAGGLELLGTDVGALTLFLVGLAAGLAILCGLALAKLGAKRSLRSRRESRRLNKLSEKLDRVEAERRRDLDDQDPDRPGP